MCCGGRTSARRVCCIVPARRGYTSASTEQLVMDDLPARPARDVVLGERTRWPGCPRTLHSGVGRRDARGSEGVAEQAAPRSLLGSPGGTSASPPEHVEGLLSALWRGSSRASCARRRARARARCPAVTGCAASAGGSVAWPGLAWPNPGPNAAAASPVAIENGARQPVLERYEHSWTSPSRRGCRINRSKCRCINWSWDNTSPVQKNEDARFMGHRPRLRPISVDFSHR
jgi:hypothetical protein